MQYKGCQLVDASVNGDYVELMHIYLISFMSEKITNNCMELPQFLKDMGIVKSR